MDFSILVVCDKYLQRLNVALGNWLRQDVRAETYEVLVSSALENDGVRNYVRNLSVTLPHQQLGLVENAPNLTKAAYQLSLIERARGRVLVLVDADMVFPTDFLSNVGADLQDGVCVWVGRAYLSKAQTYRAILGTLRLEDPTLFRRPLAGEFAGCSTHEKGPSGSCHVYTRRTFVDAGGYAGVEVRGGRYGAFAAKFLEKAEAAEVIHQRRLLDQIWAFHLWHGTDDGRGNWSGAELLW
jgi:hypothetical protein